MATGREHFVLDWIKSELLETLNEARETLDAYAESDRDETRMRSCLTCLHQVHGTLVMLEVSGVTLLADHLERLSQQLLNGTVDDESGAIQSLMQGILELPGYLDEIQSGSPDSTEPMMPLVNEIRRHIGEPTLESRTTVTELGGADEAALERFEGIDGSDKAKKIRAAYQHVLLSILKGEDRARAVRTLKKVAQGLCRICEGSPHEIQWRAFGEFVSSLGTAAGPLDGDAVKLLRRVDAEIRELVQQGVGALKSPVPMDLVNRLFEACQQRGYKSETLQELREMLVSAGHSGGLAVSGRQALASAAAALREELALVKDQLNLYARALGDSRDDNKGAVNDLAALTAPLKQIGSTLSLLGFESSSSIVTDQIDTLNSVVEAGLVEPQTLIRIASALVQVDENLASFTQGKAEIEKITDDAQRAVTVEARAGLEQVKQGIVDYISSEWDTNHLDGVPHEIAAICGALNMITLPRAARLLSSCSAYIRERLIDGDTPEWGQLDLLADAISGVDYYLERLAEASSPGSEDILHLVERSLANLGYAGARDESIEPPAPAPVEEEPSAEQEPSAGTEPSADIEPPAQDQPYATEGIVEVEKVDLGEEIELEMEDDAGFDLSNDMFDGLDDEVSAAAEELEETPSEALSEVPASDVELEELIDQPSDEASEDVEQEFSEGAPATGVQSTQAPGVASKTSTLVDVFEGDEEIIEIFVEEVGEVLENVEEWLPRWRDELTHEEALSEIRRSFHTIKGSGRIVGANIMGELAWSVENMLNRVIEVTLEPSAVFVVVVEEAVALIPRLRDAYEAQYEPDIESVGRIMERADVLASGGELYDADTPAAAEQAPAAAEQEPAGDEDTEYLEIFVAETGEHLAVLSSRAQDDGCFTLDDEAMRALHTISGSAGMAGIQAIDDLARPSYKLAQALRGDDEATGLEGDAATYFRQLLGAFSRILSALRERHEPEEHLQLIADADRLLVAAGGVEEAVGDVLMTLPALSVIMDVSEFLTNWRAGATDLGFVENLIGALGEIASRADEMSRPQISELAASLRATYEYLQHESLTDDSYRVLARSQELLLEQFDALAAGQTPSDAPDQITELHLLTLVEEAPEASEIEDAALEEQPVADENMGLEEELLALEEAEDEIEAMAVDYVVDDNAIDFPDPVLPVEPEPVDAHSEMDVGLDGLADSSLRELSADDRNDIPDPMQEVAANDPESLVPEDIDEEIIDVFFEEADELLESMDQSSHDWANEPVNRLHLENLLRGLHTLKGGARLSGLTTLGDRTHQLESFLVDVQQDSAEVGAEFFVELSAQYDALATLVAQIREAVAVRMGTTTAQPRPESDQRSALQKSEFDHTGSELVAIDDAPTVLREIAEPAAELEQESPGRAAAQQATRTDRAKELVRVGAGLLEELVNLAGESSIVRARIEQGMSDFTGALDEMETTIDRVREQLRRLEMETEAQILFRKDTSDGPSYEDFDPLEMDRYSQLQQLSRGLTESASDMLDLKDTLLVKARESETLLLQQARINTELQEGLVRTLMVPFNSLLPRLRRIVRQVSRELNKEVEFHAHNVEGELDRNLLERMVSPLEHMLRNAVDHGIESAELRSSYGKPRSGRIDLQLSREGGDVVIEISDDGAGIDVESVRAKAVEAGLMTDDAELPDEEISQFVLAPGFSTAQAVTQISGRGVGMDVVHSEVRQLGGSINISSRPGKGARFVVRVPFMPPAR